jgi:PhzF family phenazine biosynthesis protein
MKSRDKIGTMHVPIFHVDAFTSRTFSGSAFTGNPAAVCLLDWWLDDGELRKVASENNLSATAFLVACGDGYDLRWFTPACEVRLCGHATLAAGYVVLELLHPAQDVARFQTRFNGALNVHRDGTLFSMNFPAFVPKLCVNRLSALEEALGASPKEVLEANDTYIAVFEDSGAIERLRPNFEFLKRLHPFTVAVTAAGGGADFVSRYFAPSYGVLEDPVTGSAHCALAPYWAKQLGKSRLHARQLSERGGELWCELDGDRIILHGNALLTMRGTLNL